MNGRRDVFLPYGRQQIDEEDIAAVCAALRGEYLTTGPIIDEFERAFAKQVGARYAVACSSGTAALHLSVLALGLGKHDSVIVPSMTFVATANAATFVGAKVEFADVNPDNGLIDVTHVRQILSSNPKHRIKAIIPVHLNGQSANLGAIAALAEEFDLRVVEDGCHALGATFGAPTGEKFVIGDCRHSDLCVFSFHPVKIITCGEGGAVTTNDETLYVRLKRLRNHGIEKEATSFKRSKLAFDQKEKIANPWYYEMQEVGYNYRITDIQCALGLSQLKKLPSFIEKRLHLVQLYDLLLQPLSPTIKPVSRVPDCDPAWHLYSVRIEFDESGVSRASLISFLKNRGIKCQVHYIPIHLQPYYRNLDPNVHLSGAETYYQKQLSLPLFPAMSDSDVRYVVDSLAAAFPEFS